MKLKKLTAIAVGAVCAMSPAVSSAQEMNEMWGAGDIVKVSGDSIERGKLFDWGNYAMFIHWGLYSHLGNKWKGKTYYGIGEWIMDRRMANCDKTEYRAAAKTFNPVNFDARKIAALAKDAGMKYIIITSKHHEGFSMFGTKADKFNIVDATPFGRDPMKELSEACKEYGLGFGFYYSHNQDWTTPGASGGPSVDIEGNPKNFNDYFYSKCLPQVEEITKNYGDIELVWFDTPGKMPQECAQQLVDVVHRNQPHALVSGRVGYNLGDYRTLGDMEVPLENVEGMWESVDVTNDSWAYAWYDNNWKSPKQILEYLISTIARGGTYMLNVGPDGNGDIPEYAAQALRSSGKWIAAHPQVIYGAGASPWKHALPWGDVVRQGNKLYLAVYKWPSTGKLYLPGLKNEVSAAAVINGDKREKVKAVKEDGWTVVQVPYRQPNPMVSIVELTVKGDEIDVDPSFAADPELGTGELSVIFADKTDCSMYKSAWMEKFGEWKHAQCVKDLNDGGKLSWTFDVKEPTVFQVEMKVRGDGPAVWKFENGEGNFVQNRQRASGIFCNRPIGWLKFDNPGRHTVTLTMPEGGQPTDVTSITLTPVLLD